MTSKSNRKLSIDGRGIAVRIALFLGGCLALALLFNWQDTSEESFEVGNNLLVFFLVNINIIIICVLLFLIGRNVARLFLDRKRKILGARLRTRLVVAFVGLTLIPITILFILASGMLTNAVEGWLGSQVERSVTGAVEVARAHYRRLKQEVGSYAHKTALNLEERPTLPQKTTELAAFLEQQRQEFGLFGLRVLDGEFETLAFAENAAATIADFAEPEPNRDAIENALGGNPSVLFEERGAGQFIRAYVPLHNNDKLLMLLATWRIDSELSHALRMVTGSFKEFQQLKLFKHPLKSGYVLTLALITGLILFAAIWIGFYLARELTTPLQNLSEGTQEVARGNYDFEISADGDDELGFLVRSFNKMTNDLKISTRQAAARQRYIETILSRLLVGVIGLDTKRCINSVNAAAARLFEINSIDAVIGKPLAEVLSSSDYQYVANLLDEATSEVNKDSVERTLIRAAQGRELRIVCTVGEINDSEGKSIGTLLLFDDVTELSKAQHMSAWREVARRIAHEIKNPLTPIQLCAQRLSRLVQEYRDDSAIQECTHTIVEHVDSIKRLANEFSNFSRMPTAEFELSNLNLLISDTLAPYAESHAAVVFQFIGDNKMPDIMIDREQVRRIVINLLDNAISAMYSVSKDNGNHQPKIVVRTKYDRKGKRVSFEICDNGPGIPAGDKVRIFEPYFTTKKSGTGLGLAVVTSIVSDHQGDIRVYDNLPSGAKFCVELPLVPVQGMPRRMAAEG